MPNQRDIAKAAGVNQTTVSLALRNSPSISQATRDHVHEVAARLGYRPNPYVASLMAHIGAGRKPQEHGCIALLVAKSDGVRKYNQRGSRTFRLQQKGLAERAKQLGFSTEFFEINDGGMNPARIDGILQARGINGLVFSPPKVLDVNMTDLTLSRYAMVSITYSWLEPRIDRVATNHRHNVQLAYRKLLEKGYTRIGMCLPEEALWGVDGNWLAGYLLQRELTPRPQQIPLFVGKPGVTPIAKFQGWLKKWKPDAIVGLIGHEKDWLDELKIDIPGEIAIACVNRLPDSSLSGVEENHEVVGATAIEMVAAQIMRNEYGPPAHPRTIFIEGEWVDGETTR
jgi:LacI family transcriptional regulator